MENEVKKVTTSKINEVLTATTNNAKVDLATAAISNRALLYNRDEEALFIKYRDNLIKLGMLPDEDNIVSRLKKDQVAPADVDRIALNEFIHVNGLRVDDGLSGMPIDTWYAHKIFSKGKSIESLNEENYREKLITIDNTNEVLVLISEKNEKLLPANEYFAGEIILGAEDFSSVSHYTITLTSNSLEVTPSIIGSTTLSRKAKIVKRKDGEDNNIFGIYFPGLARETTYYAFFTGWYRHNGEFPYTQQYDRKEWVMIEVDDGSGGGGGGEGGTSIFYSRGDIFEVLASSEIEARQLLPLTKNEIEEGNEETVPNYTQRLNKGILSTECWNLIKVDYRVGDLITINNIEENIAEENGNGQHRS